MIRVQLYNIVLVWTFGYDSSKELSQGVIEV